MTEYVFSILRRTVVYLGGFVLVALMFGELLNHSAVAMRQRQPRTPEQIVGRIRKAHILANVPENAFKSFLLSGCMRIDRSLLRKAKSNSDVNCIAEQTGVLQPSLTYVTVTVGTPRITELVDIKQGKGWQIIDPATLSSKPSRTISGLQKMKYDALVENAEHSLPALLGLLQGSDNFAGMPIEVIADAKTIVVKWRTERSLNEFFFDKRTFLCEKQVRTVGSDQSVLTYSNYKRVANVMLPHTITVAKGDGMTIATREVLNWKLAMQWPEDHFHPETIRVLQ